MITATRGVRRDSEAAAFVRVRRLIGRALGRFKERTGKSASHGDPFYWKFVEFEFGNARARAQPFLRPAFDAKKEQAAMEIKKTLAAGVERQAERLAK
jgi:HK97 gp10 family phage protein